MHMIPPLLVSFFFAVVLVALVLDCTRTGVMTSSKLGVVFGPGSDVGCTRSYYSAILPVILAVNIVCTQ
jgi:hypothetical protein